MPSVIVVGAGIAGLSAARTLLDAGAGFNVTVFEASNRLGGRTFSNYTAAGFGEVLGGEADIGASWLHGSCPEHPITRIKNAMSLQGFVTLDSSATVYFSDGTEVDKDRYDEFEDMIADAAAKAKSSATDISMWDAMSDLKNDPLMQYHMTNSLEFNVGCSPDLLSGKYAQDDDQFKGAETILQKGYSQIVNALANGAVKLDAGDDDTAPTVTAVTSGRKAVQISTGRRVVQISRVCQSTQLQVGFDSGSPVLADHVIVAAPLGVLKKGVISFSPAVSQTKQTAISRLGFGNVVKIGILFDKVFWPASTHYFGLVPSTANLSNAEKFGYFLNAQPAVSRPIMFTFAFGSSAYEVEKWSDDAVWANVRQNLEKMFGKAKVGQKVAMWRSYWASDPNIGGAYSYAGVGSTPGDWAQMAKAEMDGSLHFAGEHTSHTYRGTVHGAFFSGQRAAREILEAGAAKTFSCSTTTSGISASGASTTTTPPNKGTSSSSYSQHSSLMLLSGIIFLIRHRK